MMRFFDLRSFFGCWNHQVDGICWHFWAEFRWITFFVLLLFGGLLMVRDYPANEKRHWKRILGWLHPLIKAASFASLPMLLLAPQKLLGWNHSVIQVIEYSHILETWDVWWKLMKHVVYLQNSWLFWGDDSDSIVTAIFWVGWKFNPTKITFPSDRQSGSRQIYVCKSIIYYLGWIHVGLLCVVIEPGASM